jgi:putative endonuclease
LRRGRAYVYILSCSDGSLYTGSAKDLDKRFRQHQAGTASRYTRSRRPVELAWSCALRTWGAALGMERTIKSLTRAEKLALVRAQQAARGAGRCA